MPIKAASEGSVDAVTTGGAESDTCPWTRDQSQPLGLSHEPALQHKKRIGGPPTSLSANFNSEGGPAWDDYTLLGKQDKFASNVRYGGRQPVKAAEEPGEALNVNNSSKDGPPPKQMRIEAPSEAAKPKQRVMKVRKEGMEENLTPTSPPPAPRPGQQQAGVEKEGLKDKNLNYPTSPPLKPRPWQAKGKKDGLKDKNLNNPTSPPLKLRPRQAGVEKDGLTDKNLNNPTSPPLKPRLRQAGVEKEELKDKNLNNPTSPPLKPRHGQQTGSEKEELKDKNLNNPNSPPLKPRREQAWSEKEELKDKNLNNLLYEPRGRPPVRRATSASVDAGPREATDNYSLQYKAGVVPARQGKKLSEYQKEFGWKDRMSASPLLSAEQIVYRSHPDVLFPSKKKTGGQTTEYQSEFKTYPLPQEMDRVVKRVAQQLMPPCSPPKSQLKRSKSVGACESPDRSHPAGVDPVVSATDPRQLRESEYHQMGVPKVPVLPSNQRQVASEYRSNFRAPAAYAFDGGTWKNAFPPHLFHSKEEDLKHVAAKPPEEEGEPSQYQEQGGADSNWYAEVLELRRRAHEYKRRAEGTHFSREHLLQLLAKQNEYWEARKENERPDRPSQALDALDLESHKGAGSIPSGGRSTGSSEVKVDAMAPVPVNRWFGNTNNNNNNNATLRPTDVSANNVTLRHTDVNANNATQKPSDGRPIRKVKAAWSEKRSEQEPSGKPPSGKAGTSTFAAESRPQNHGQNASHPPDGISNQIADLNTNQNAACDLDTDQNAVCDLDMNQDADLNTNQNAMTEEETHQREGGDWVGGRLPTPTLRQIGGGTRAPRHHLDLTTPSVGGLLLSLRDQDQLSTKSDVSDQITSDRKRAWESGLRTVPILGKATQDSHFLRDDDAESDHILPTHFIGVPAIPAVEKVDRRLKALQRRVKAKIPDTIDERMGQTYNKEAPSLPQEGNAEDKDDDALSLSARSIASSSSLASDLYQRTRKRRDQFWGKPGH